MHNALLPEHPQPDQPAENAPHDVGHHPAHPATDGDGFLGGLFRIYVPRRECMYGEADLVWTHFISDVLITGAYFSIPVALMYFYRKREDLAFNWIFVLFATFIFACGATHLFQTFALWAPLYRLEAVVKIVTAIASVGTALVLWPLIPKALALPSPAALRAANMALEAEIQERREAQELLRRAHGQLEDRVRERTAELERLSRLKDDFLATLSHELRTPLNAILGWVYLMKEGKLDEQGAREGLEVIERNTRTQTRLVSDLLDMSRIIAGKLYLEVGTIDLAEVAASAIKTVEPAAEANGIRIEADFADDLGPVLGDADRLQQMIWNLLSNAVKFTPRGGLVRVTLRRVNSKVELRVIDTGIGMAPEVLPYVFEKFRQADQGITRRHGGLGLGLAIVRHIAELHGGTVEVESPGLGQGSTFVVRLPIMPLTSPAPSDESVRPREGPASKGKGLNLAGACILVVDDDRDAVAMVRQLLVTYGSQVLTAGSAAEALERFDSDRPELVISDIGMAERDGYELIRRLRERSDVPAIALTAFARAEDARRALEAGFQRHIAKPADPGALLQAVVELLPGRRHASEE